jgi:hypothetical protein
MDRRYEQSRFYNNVKASKDSQDEAERLLNMYKSRFNAESKKAQTYGGSTGGRKSTEQWRGEYAKRVLSERAAKQKEQSKIFDIEGRGEYGARKEFGKEYTQARAFDREKALKDIIVGDRTDIDIKFDFNEEPKRRYTGNIFEDSDAFRPSEDEEDK